MSGRARLGLLLALLGLLQAAPSRAATMVRDVRVENLGGGTLDTASVLAFTSLGTGDEFDRNAVARDVRALQQTGRYTFVGANVEPSATGVVLVYQIKSKPRLQRLNITGADYMTWEKVRKLLELEKGDLVDDAVLAEAVAKVKEKYTNRHFPYARIDWVVQENEALGEADVEIIVKEGERAKIGRVTILGNEAIKTKEIRKVMRQRRSNFLSFFTKTGRYNPDDLEVDMYAVRRLYLDKGYLDVVLDEPEVVPLGQKKIEIKVPVTEGRQYTVRSFEVKGHTLFPVDELARTVTVREGQVASLSGIETSASAIRDYYGSRGYIRTAVRDQIDADAATAEADVTYSIKEGTLAYIRTIQVRGNDRTKDKVIRRELAVYPGEIFDEVKVRRSERRLMNLGYFESVYSSPESTPEPEKYDLTFDLEEKRTGQFVVGAGFSSIDDLIGFVEVSQGNFDISKWPNFTGGGQKMKLRAQAGTSRTDLEISFTEPWFLDRKLSLGVTLFHNDRRFLSDDYDQRNTGASISLGKPLPGYFRTRLEYTIENIDVYDVDDTASDIIKAEEGSRIKSSLSPELIFDSRDNVFIPTRGNRSNARFEVAGGPLGGDTDLYKIELRSTHYVPLWFDHVFNLRGWLGTVEEYGDSDNVPIFDRLFLGGARTLRGFKYREVGPKDETGEPIGGKSGWYGTSEYTVPIVGKVRGALYYDIGMVVEDSFQLEFGDYNSDWGVGLRLDLPQFPLRLDYAWPVEADEFNDSSSGRFNFLLGYLF